MATINNQNTSGDDTKYTNTQKPELIKNDTFAKPDTPSYQTNPVPVPPQDVGPIKRSVTGKIIATIFGIILLVAGIAAGVLLIGQNQEIREQAAGSDACIKSYLCEFIDEPEDSGIHEARLDISRLIITEKKTRQFNPGVSDDGCYQVTISRNVVMWNRYNTGPGCPKIINIQVWLKSN